MVEQHGLLRQQLTIDLTLRRMFLLNGHLPLEDIEYVLENVPHAYDSNSPYLRALTSLARGTYSIQQTIALLFCFTRLSQRDLRNLINRHYIFHLLFFVIVFACETNSIILFFHCIMCTCMFYYQRVVIPNNNCLNFHVYCVLDCFIIEL